jgi:hypothetical protein
MAATIKGMELKKVDVLAPGSLEVGDLIGVDGDILEVTGIEDQGDLFYIEVTNEFGEVDELEYSWDALIDWYYFQNDPDDE